MADAGGQLLEGVVADLSSGLLSQGPAPEAAPLPVVNGDATAAAHSDELNWDQFDIAALEATTGARPLSSLPAAARARLAAARQRLVAALLSPQRILLRDKLSFLLGNGLVWTMAYWLGWSPQTFYVFYTGQVLVLMAIRFCLYRMKKEHYYLLDYCYFSNVVMLVHIWLLPKSLLLSKITFAFNTGPLTWSTIAFRNSLVFHDLDKVTSVFVHLVPAALSWTLRWHRDASRFGPPPDAPAEQQRAWAEASLVQLVLQPLLPYVVWAVAYYLKIFVISAERIKQRGYSTLFQYVTTTRKGVYAAIARRVPPQRRPQVYLFLHMCFCLTTFLLSWLCWRSFVTHTALLVAMGAISCWHGATFYFDVFAVRYLAELELRKNNNAAAAAAPPGGTVPASKAE